jgi:hypothetical protein
MGYCYFMLDKALFREPASLNKQYAGEQRNLFPQLIDFFEKNRQEVQGLVDVVNSDLRRYQYPTKLNLNFEDLRQKAILAVLHKAPKQIGDKEINKEIDAIVEPISKKINNAEPSPVVKSSAERRFIKIQADLPDDVKQIVGAAFKLNNLEEVAWDLCTSLDKVFSALRFFERKMYKNQSAPVAREFSKKHVPYEDWSKLTDLDREALIAEFAGFHRDDTARHLGVTNRTLTNRFTNIRNFTGVDRESFDQIKRRQALVNIDREKLLDDRLINFVFDKAKLEANENKKNKDPFYLAVMSLSHADMVLKIKEALDCIPERFSKAVLTYVDNDDIHTNSLTGKSTNRTLGFAKKHIRRILKAMLLEKAPEGIKASQWADFKSAKVRSALRLYLQGFKRQTIEKMTSQQIGVETFWNWKQAFMDEFGYDKESLAKLRLRNKIARLKKDKKTYRKRAFDIVFPKTTMKPKQLKSETKDDYYARMLSLVNQVAALYPRKETYGYFKHRIIGLSANELAGIYGLTKGSPIMSIKNFANFAREKIYELDKFSQENQANSLSWLKIDKAHRPIIEAYLKEKTKSGADLYLRLRQQFPNYSVKQLQAITHQGRQKLGIRLIDRSSS